MTEGQSNRVSWRTNNVGCLLNNAVRRFEARVLELMARAGYAQTRMAHVSLTRNLDIGGTRVTDLARRASMSKQAMAELVEQCEALDLVRRSADPSDRRARLVTFTAFGLEWLDVFRSAVDAAEREMTRELGPAAMANLLDALRDYGHGVRSPEETPLIVA